MGRQEPHPPALISFSISKEKSESLAISENFSFSSCFFALPEIFWQPVHA